MKIRINEPAYKNFTGSIGAIDFVDGESVHDLSERDATRMGAIYNVVEVGNEDVQLGPHNQFNAALTVEAETVPIVYSERDEKTKEIELAVVDSLAFTKEDLEKIADAKGIAGLREIADKVGVRGKSISALIDGILSRGV
jgi:hypothetical protein